MWYMSESESLTVSLIQWDVNVVTVKRAVKRSHYEFQNRLAA